MLCLTMFSARNKKSIDRRTLLNIVMGGGGVRHRPEVKYFARWSDITNSEQPSAAIPHFNKGEQQLGESVSVTSCEWRHAERRGMGRHRVRLGDAEF